MPIYNVSGSATAEYPLVIDRTTRSFGRATGDILVAGTQLILDADNVGAGADCLLVANQGTDDDGVIRYNSTTNLWELSNTLGVYNAIVDASRTVSTAARLAGGGALSANLTLDLASGVVTPGSYTSANITVDTYGRVTAAANGSAAMAIGGAITGGAVGNVLFVGPGPTLDQAGAGFFWDDTNNSLNLSNLTTTGNATTSTDKTYWDLNTVFAPTAGTGKYVALKLATQINQTGSATGNFTMLDINVTNTASTGTLKRLIDGKVGGSTVFAVNIAGSITQAGDIDMSGTGPSIRALTSNNGIVINGMQSAGSANADVSLGGQVVRTAGKLVSIKNNTTEYASFQYHGGLSIAPAAVASGTGIYLENLTTPTHGGATPGLTLSTENKLVVWDLTGPTTWATGALTTQRFAHILAPTIAFVGASTVTTATTLAIAGAPAAGSNATITNALALHVEAGTSRLAGLLQADGQIDRSTAAGLTIGATTATTMTLGRTGQTITAPGNLTVTQTLTSTGTLTANGTINLGDAAADVITITGSPNFVNGFELASTPSLAVSTANRARLRYDQTTSKLQVSLNTAAYVDVATGAGGGGMSIGGAVTGGTTGSILFVGAGPVLDEDAAHLSWDASGNTLNTSKLLTSGGSSASTTDVNIWELSQTFAPTTAAAKYIALKLASTINQTGSATGDYTMLDITATETAATGANKYLIHCKVGAAVNFIVHSSGGLTTNGNINMSGTSPLIRPTTTNQSLQIEGRQSAALTATDILLQSAFTRTAGNIVAFRNVSTIVSSIAYHGGIEIVQGAAATGAPYLFKATSALHTGLTASTEIPDVDLDLSQTKTWATGAITTQRAVKITAPAYAFAASSTIATAATVAISGPPAAGTNATITNAHALMVDAGTSTGNGIRINKAPSSAMVGAGLQIIMGANCDGPGIDLNYSTGGGNGINITHSQSGTGLAGIVINTAGGGRGIHIALSGSTTNRGLSIIDTLTFAYSNPSITVTRISQATGNGIEVIHPGTGHAYNAVISGATGFGLNVQHDALATTSTATGIRVQNTTAAAAAAQQASPDINLSGRGWGTTAGTSQSIDWSIRALPVQSTVPTSQLEFAHSVAGGAYTTEALLDSSGRWQTDDGTSTVMAYGFTGLAGLGMRRTGNVLALHGNTQVQLFTGTTSRLTMSTTALSGTSDGAMDCGISGARWRDLYASRSLVIAGATAATGSPSISVTPVGPTAQTASTETPDVLLALNRTVTFAAGALAAQRAVKITPPAYTGATITTAATVAVSDAPTGATNNYAIWVEAGKSRFDGIVETGGETITPASALSQPVLKIVVPSTQTRPAMQVTGRNGVPAFMLDPLGFHEYPAVFFEDCFAAWDPNANGAWQGTNGTVTRGAGRLTLLSGALIGQLAAITGMTGFMRNTMLPGFSVRLLPLSLTTSNSLFVGWRPTAGGTGIFALKRDTSVSTNWFVEYLSASAGQISFDTGISTSSANVDMGITLCALTNSSFLVRIGDPHDAWNLSTAPVIVDASANGGLATNTWGNFEVSVTPRANSARTIHLRHVKIWSQDYTTS